jgi:hypothetical protein
MYFDFCNSFSISLNFKFCAIVNEEEEEASGGSVELLAEIGLAVMKLVPPLLTDKLATAAVVVVVVVDAVAPTLAPPLLGFRFAIVLINELLPPWLIVPVVQLLLLMLVLVLAVVVVIIVVVVVVVVLLLLELSFCIFFDIMKNTLPLMCLRHLWYTWPSSIKSSKV